MKSILTLATCIFLSLTLQAQAGSFFSKKSLVETFDVHQTAQEGIGGKIGTISLADGAQGLIITPNLQGLPEGAHGFHVHANGDCGPSTKPDGSIVPGGAAGGHFDPDGTGFHGGPDGTGHLGDLPALTVDDTGAANTSVTASRLSLDNVLGQAIIIHLHGDNFSDDPKPLGGGGARFACALLK